MRHKLWIRFSAFYLLFVMVTLVLFSVFMPTKIYDHLLKSKTAQLQQVAQELADFPEVYNCDFQSAAEDLALNSSLTAIAKTQECIIWLVHKDGQVLMSSDLSYPMEQALKIPNFSGILEERPCQLTGDFFGMFHHQVRSILMPVSVTPHTTDYVIVHYEVARLETSQKYLMKICFWMLTLFYTVSLFLPLAVYFLFYRPLRKLIALSHNYLTGNLNLQSPPSDDSEFSALQTNINFLAEEIRHTEDYQRNFVSNISHDFRSPLTSIRGYAEAILDGTIPKESQDKYLQIILTEAERLTRLTQNILNTNNLQGNGMMLDLSVFDISDMLHSIAASLEIQCRKKDIKILFCLPQNHLEVRADKIKIQQVVYNLLDNAIKFSPSHSFITVSASRKQKYVFVSIKDHGEGIPANQIPKIFNRFYKSDASRNKDKHGTGLGLSIVREILTAHKQNINVISTEGVGSEFVFTLERA